MNRTRTHIHDRISELTAEFTRHNASLDYPKAELAMALIIELTDLLMVIEAELDGFKPKHND